MTSVLDDIFEKEQRSIKIAELFNIANIQFDSHREFAKKCIKATFTLSDEGCKDFFNKHGFVLYDDQPNKHLLIIQTLLAEDFRVSVVRNAWETHINSLKKRFFEALYIEVVLNELEDNDPFESIYLHLNERFDHGSTSLQKDLKPVLAILNDHRTALLSGITQLALMLDFQNKDYVQKIVAAFTTNKIPQKGLLIGLTLIAQKGGAEITLPKSNIEAIKALLNPPASGNLTSKVSRLSETKTVLSALGLATVTRGQHFANPKFSTKVEKMLNELIARNEGNTSQ